MRLWIFQLENGAICPTYRPKFWIFLLHSLRCGMSLQRLARSLRVKRSVSSHQNGMTKLLVLTEFGAKNDTQFGNCTHQTENEQFVSYQNAHEIRFKISPAWEAADLIFSRPCASKNTVLGLIQQMFRKWRGRASSWALTGIKKFRQVMSTTWNSSNQYLFYVFCAR